MEIAYELRRHQEKDPTMWAFFTALHTFADRTVDRFFDDVLPQPVICLDRVKASCKGEYQPKDGMGLIHRITIDPYKVANGEEAAEVLAHELVHMWQCSVGRLPERNYHNSEFHSRLGLMGIMSNGKAGHHLGYMEMNVWQDWLDENADLQLAHFILPGQDEPKRVLHKFVCECCGFSFRTRRAEVEVRCENTDECGIVMVEAGK